MLAHIVEGLDLQIEHLDVVVVESRGHANIKGHLKFSLGAKIGNLEPFGTGTSMAFGGASGSADFVVFLSFLLFFVPFSLTSDSLDFPSPGFSAKAPTVRVPTKKNATSLANKLMYL